MLVSKTWTASACADQVPDITQVLRVSLPIDAWVPAAVSRHSLPVIMASLTKEMVYGAMLA